MGTRKIMNFEKKKRGGPLNLDLTSIFRAKLEKVHRAAGCKGVRKQSDIVTCHRWECFRSFFFHRARSHPGKKNKKGRTLRIRAKEGRKERRRRVKSGSNGAFAAVVHTAVSSGNTQE